ncbi:MAG: hypothetical protein GF331_16900 [Chitinivibrionales bacterium]|nr:hypothetical protein [Chitinivibrionales bacterium]
MLVVTQAIAIARRATRMQQETVERRDQLAHAEKLVAMGTLVSSVAHEISNPNNAIRLSAGTLERSWDEITRVLDEYAQEHGELMIGGMSYRELKQEFPEALRRTTRNSDRIKHIVDDLRRFAQRDEDRAAERVDVNAVVRSAVSLLEHTLGSSTRNLRMELRDAVPAVKGRAQRLEQVVVNLLNNARQALTAAEQAIAISTGHDTQQRQVDIIVRDEGPGDGQRDAAAGTDVFLHHQRGGGRQRVRAVHLPTRACTCSHLSW